MTDARWLTIRPRQGVNTVAIHASFLEDDTSRDLDRVGILACVSCASKFIVDGLTVANFRETR